VLVSGIYKYGEVQVIAPKDLLGGHQGVLRNIKVIDYSFCSEYQKFLETMNMAIKKSGYDLKVSKYTDYLLNMNKQPAVSIRVKGLADIYHYSWPNGEYKIMSVMSKLLITNDIDWIDYYPFLEKARCNRIVGEKDIRVIFREDLFRAINEERGFGIDKLYVNLTHNGHFGHFMLDDLPAFVESHNGLLLETSEIKQVGYCNKGIRELVESYIQNDSCKISYDELGKHQKNFVLRSVPLQQNFITNHSLKSYLLMKAIKKIRSKVRKSITTSAKTAGKRIFFLRDGEYRSRISNLEEIRLTLEDLDFMCIEPSNYTLDDLIMLCQKAEIVVSEPGTCTICAQVFTEEHCSVIALVPRRFLIETDNPMLCGGIPYHFITPEKVRFVLGKTIVKHAIQTSDVAYYDPEDVVRAINKVVKEFREK
jgi:hypothetical protein